MRRRVAVALPTTTAFLFPLIPIPVQVHYLLSRRHPVQHHLPKTGVLAVSHVDILDTCIHVDAQLGSRGLSFLGGVQGGRPVVLFLVRLEECRPAVPCLINLHMEVRQLFRPSGAPGLLLPAVEKALVHLPAVCRDVLPLEARLNLYG